MTTSKVYIETFWQIHRMIEEAGLQPGDRLPSERELADRLQVGRSSVREALRALELLGLIETRPWRRNVYEAIWGSSAYSFAQLVYFTRKSGKKRFNRNQTTYGKNVLTACLQTNDGREARAHCTS